MNALRLDFLTAAFVCAAIGLATGYWIAPRSGPHTHAEAENDGDEQDAISAATLVNLGVQVDVVELTNFTLTTPVAARVVAPPDSERPLVAPLGGRVRAVHVSPGQQVAPGAPLATFVREPLPLPTLTLTSEVLRPGQEALHDSVVELHRAAEELEIARAERDRVTPFTTAEVEGVPLLPRARAIELEYTVRRAEQAWERAKLELFKHGLSEAQVRAVEAGEHLPLLDDDKWRRALERNGLWPPSAEYIFNTLPEQLKRLPWAAATAGELAARGLATADLADWLSTDPPAGEHFLEIGVLLQRGHSLEDVRELFALGALEPVVVLRAPGTGAAGDAWDVDAVDVRVGTEVTAGQRLMTLSNPTRMWLEAAPLGSEVPALLAAVRADRRLTARPLVSGAGPELLDLEGAFVSGEPGTGGTLARIEVPNSLVAESGAESGLAPRRTWALREGLEYVVEIPTLDLDRVIVLPTEAVAESGSDTVLVIETEAGFAMVPVVVAHRDDRVVVIDPRVSSEPHPGDRVVVRGAFALSLALVGSDDVGAHHH